MSGNVQEMASTCSLNLELGHLLEEIAQFHIECQMFKVLILIFIAYIHYKLVSTNVLPHMLTNTFI